MLCPNCRAQNSADDTYCHVCHAELQERSMSLTTSQRHLPAVLQNTQLSKGVAAGVGAVALGVGIELLRRSLISKLTQVPSSSRALENALPTVDGLKDILFPQNNKPLKPPKGYEIHETVVYMRRVIRRQH